jgi:hypothetical protein
VPDEPAAFHRPYWGEPRYVFDGDTIWVPFAHDDSTGVTRAWRCKVACAAGDQARVVNEKIGLDRWYRLSALLVPPEDPRHWNQVGAVHGG